MLYGVGGGHRHVCWLVGAAVFRKSWTVERRGGGDPHFFLHYEDKDFCIRARKSGAPVVLCNRVRWFHRGARETTQVKAMPWKREFASMYKFYRPDPEFLLSRGIARETDPKINSTVYLGDA